MKPQKLKSLAKMIAFAAEKHAGQFDRAGQPYILHPLKLQHWLRNESETVQMVAIGHDLMEDCGVTFDDLCDRFGMTVARAVLRLTKTDGIDYDDYIADIAKCPIATKVKLMDLRHNSDIRRLKSLTLTQKDFDRIVKYQKSYALLKRVMIENNWSWK